MASTIKKANEIKPGEATTVFRTVDRVTLLNDDTVVIDYTDNTSTTFKATDDVTVQ